MADAVRIRLKGNVRAVTSGVREVLKSDGVAAMLGAQAEAAARRANAMCSPQMRKAGAEYVAEVVQRGYTAGGRVSAGNRFARIDNYRNNTMKKATGL